MGRDPKQTSQAWRAEVEAGLRHRAVTQAQPDSVAVERPEAVTPSLLEALEGLLTRDDGWLRISPQNDGRSVYFKWKFTAGKYRDTYVMTVYPYHQCTEGLARLASKIDAVYRGEQTPVKDHYFKG